MGKINWSRVVLGGLLAGLILNVSEFILNVVVVADRFAAAMQALGISGGESSASMVVWIIYGFVLGIAVVWLYAAIRPRYGPGAKTAVCAGLAAWLFTTLLPSIGLINLGLFPTGLMAIGIIWALVEMPIATAVGAWLYQE